MSGRPILVMAGGTGGHVYPALAVAQALEARSQNVVWLGTHRGLESSVVPDAGIDIEWVSVRGLRRNDAGIDIEWVSVRGLRRKGLLALLIAPLQIAWALLQSLSVILRRRPVAVLGMGGFVSGPGGLAAWLTRRPLVIHEQNAAAGLTNRLLARLARVVLQAFNDRSYVINVAAGHSMRPARPTLKTGLTSSSCHSSMIWLRRTPGRTSSSVARAH